MGLICSHHTSLRVSRHCKAVVCIKHSDKASKTPPEILLATTKVFALLIASSHAAPPQGCEWLPETVAVTDFTYTFNTTDFPVSTFATWKASAVNISCSTPNPGALLPFFLCRHDPEQGGLRISVADRKAEPVFSIYPQCAADMYKIWYRAEMQLDCVTDEKEVVTCGAKGNVTASMVAASL